jgi:hypothetical protein
MAKVAGSLWVEADGSLHYVDGAATEYRFVGNNQGPATGALNGSIWVEGAYLAYVAQGYKYLCPYYMAQSSVTAAVKGSLWIETAQLHWIENSNKHDHYAHTDVAHHNWYDDWSDHNDGGAYANWTDQWDDHTDWDDIWTN